MQPFVIAPSILAADFARLGEEVENVLAAGADWVHFDVMDNHYVPNLTIGPMVCKALRDFGVSAPIDVHLMVQPVDELIGLFAKAGATYITFHPDASIHVDRSLQLVRDAGCKCGLVFNPAASLDSLRYVIDKIDMVLLMSVNPGFFQRIENKMDHRPADDGAQNLREVAFHASPLPGCQDHCTSFFHTNLSASGTENQAANQTTMMTILHCDGETHKE